MGGGIQEGGGLGDYPLEFKKRLSSQLKKSSVRLSHCTHQALQMLYNLSTDTCTSRCKDSVQYTHIT